VETAPKVFNVWKGSGNFSTFFVFLKILKFVRSNDREVVIEFSFLIFRVEILQKFATKNQKATNVILWQTFRF